MVLFHHGKESQYSDKEPLLYIIELFIDHIIGMILSSGKRLHKNHHLIGKLTISMANVVNFQ